MPTHFLCLAKESKPRKATPAWRSSGLPSVGREPKVSLHSFGAERKGEKTANAIISALFNRIAVWTVDKDRHR